MNAVIYASKGGNTKKLADAIALAIGVSALPAKDVGTFNEKVDILFLGASIYVGSISGSLRSFLNALTSEKVSKVAVFGSAAGDKSAAGEVRAILMPKGIDVLDEHFQCRGSFLLANRGKPNADDLANAAGFAKRIVGV
jgi:flavodoxin